MADWTPGTAAGEYPATLSGAFDQGARDYRNGYPIVWWPNLGPLAADSRAVERWRDGWRAARETAVREMIARRAGGAS